MSQLYGFIVAPQEKVFMKAYLNLLQDIIDNGTTREDRTGVGTRAIFGRQIRFDLQAGFPLLTTKRLHTRSIILELLWFLSGRTNVKWLQDRGCRIWDPWADKSGDLGPVYGFQWRSWPQPNGKSVDQISNLLTSLRQEPNSRRLIVVAWNPADLAKMALPPCHCLFQFFVADGKLSCQLYQRSCDVFIGLGFNIASYSLLTHMIAQQVGLEVGEFIWTGGDIHLYQNHLEQVKIQLGREPKGLPQLQINRKPPSLFEYTLEDFSFCNYEAHPHIKAEVAV